MYTLQGEYDRYIRMYGASLGYGGAQAGTGTGGVDGVGVITVHEDGSVTSENGVATTQTLPDGTKVTTVVVDGERFQRIEYTDGTTKTTEEWPTSTDDNGNIRLGGSRVELTAINDTKTTTITRDDGSKYFSVLDKDGHGTEWNTLPNGTKIKSVVDQLGNVQIYTRYPDGTWVDKTIDGEKTDIFARSPSDDYSQHITIDDGIITEDTVYDDGRLTTITTEFVQQNTKIAYRTEKILLLMDLMRYLKQQ